MSHETQLNPVPDSRPYGPPPLDPITAGRRSSRGRVWVHIVLFALTVLSTTYIGAVHYASFASEFARRPVVADAALLLNGLWYSVTILGILMAHEMGHYLYCRYYRLDASLPYFLPFPNFVGTVGAVIRIREPFGSRTQLFDVGIAGPIGGLLVLIPLLFFGLSLSTVVPGPTEGEVLNLGEPLLFQWAAHLVVGPVPPGMAINIHPIVFACWFGMFATALNLIPFGQFDGGHIVYAVGGERVARWVSTLSLLGSASLIYMSLIWIVPAVLMGVMWRLIGLRHPSPLNPYEPLPPGRRLFALVALIAFILCFTPAPITIEQLVSGPEQLAFRAH